MTEAWKLQGLSSTQKLVLLSLADNANDQGECYPSLAQICARTCLSERAVRGAIRALEDMGYVKSVSRLGTSTMYHLTTTPAHGAPPAGNAPRQEMPPRGAPDAALPRHDVPPTPARGAPKPSINRQLNHHLTVTKRRVKGGGFDAAQIELPDWLPADAWAKWVKHRREIKKALTEETTKQQIAKLHEWHEQGHRVNEIIDHCVGAGWQGLFLPNNWSRPAGAAQQPKKANAHGNFGSQDYRAGVGADGSF
ncbi:hypothetical protein CAL13_08775 [Bordetella genomosp. 9]|uniref:Helix-turn-helix domain-containing protein n=2 Tax=Bordetella genomosp. 9 TaxID=1416803 RepID=A0A1W6Z5J0_9BORD|nr:hypothetical protein CAL13_08775 [Bordetella genomosp. 9]